MAPLAVGTHTIHFDATISSFVEDTTYLSPDGAPKQRQGQRRQLRKALLQSGLGSPCRSQDRDAQRRVLPGLDSHHRPDPDHQSHYRCTDRQHQPELNTNELVLITVLDYLSLTVGSTSVQAGQNATVPIYLA